MNLTANEAAIRDIVLEEFQKRITIGYAEKKHVVETLDGTWLDREVRKLANKGRILPWVMIVGGALVGLAWGAFGVVGSDSVQVQLVRLIQMLFALSVFVGAGIVHLHNRSKRLLLFRILRVIAGTPETAETRPVAAVR